MTAKTVVFKAGLYTVVRHGYTLEVLRGEVTVATQGFSSNGVRGKLWVKGRATMPDFQLCLSFVLEYNLEGK